jgi:hypothetical protein
MRGFLGRRSVDQTTPPGRAGIEREASIPKAKPDASPAGARPAARSAPA